MGRKRGSRGRKGSFQGTRQTVPKVEQNSLLSEVQPSTIKLRGTALLVMRMAKDGPVLCTLQGLSEVLNVHKRTVARTINGLVKTGRLYRVKVGSLSLYSISPIYAPIDPLEGLPARVFVEGLPERID